jgi:eukaryotic-like serine/threonine-protein kinase
MRWGPIPRDQAVSIVMDIAAALHYAHRRDMVHRDVKPGNILLRIQ